jgi:hypothetical protein
MSSGIDIAESQRRERVRSKLLGSMLTAYGYALLAGGAWEPLAKGHWLTPFNMFGIAAGLVAHASALYIAPRGEPR